jgi:hypothetical protein
MYNAIMRVSGLVRELDALGMRVVIGDDFSEYRILRSSLSDRAPMYPMFDITSSYIDATNGFWICGFGPKDELIHTQAVRLLDLSGISLGEHLDMHRHKYITPDTTPDPDLTYYSGPGALGSITGRVCYHGDFWLQASGLGGIRGQGVTGALVRTLFEVIHLNWMPDYVFALVAQPVAEKGASPNTTFFTQLSTTFQSMRGQSPVSLTTISAFASLAALAYRSRTSVSLPLLTVTPREWAKASNSSFSLVSGIAKTIALMLSERETRSSIT